MLLTAFEQFDCSQVDAVARWHVTPPQAFGTDFSDLVLHQHYYNFLIWHAEDIGRNIPADDHAIADAKREIHLYNKCRHDLIEQLDLALDAWLSSAGYPQNPYAPLNSESPGSIIDRCSILTIRIYHRKEAAAALPSDSPDYQCLMQDVKLLLARRQDLVTCFHELMDEVAQGKRRFELYRHFKIYSLLDPATPSLPATRSQEQE